MTAGEAGSKGVHDRRIRGAGVDGDILVDLEGVEDGSSVGIIGLAEGEGEHKRQRHIEEARLVEPVLPGGVLGDVHRGLADLRQPGDVELELAGLGGDELLDLGEVGEGPAVPGEPVEVDPIGELAEGAHDGRLHHLLRRALVGGDGDWVRRGDVGGAGGGVDEVVSPADEIGFPDPVVGVVGEADGGGGGGPEVDPGGEGEEAGGFVGGAVEAAVERAELEGGDEGLPRGGVGEADGEGVGSGEDDGFAGEDPGVVVDDDGGPAGGAEVEVELREDGLVGGAAVEEEVGVEEGGAEEVAGAGGDLERVAVLVAVRREVAESAVLGAAALWRGGRRRLGDREGGAGVDEAGVGGPLEAQRVGVVGGAAAVDAQETCMHRRPSLFLLG